MREKCGWLGDALIITDTVIYNWDSLHFWEKYLGDIATSRKITGYWSQVAPGKKKMWSGGTRLGFSSGGDSLVFIFIL